MTDHSENKILKLADQFRSMEVKHNLFNLQSKDGIYYWDILRFHVHLNILIVKGFLPNTTTYMNPAREPKLKRVLKAIRLLPLFIINEFRRISFLEKKRKNAFLFISRFQDGNGNPEDSLIKDIHDQLEKDSFVMELFRHKKFGWFKGNIGGRYFLYSLELRYLLGKNKQDDWSDLSKIINTEFGVDIQWGEIFHALVNNYRKEYIFFSYVFKKIKPQFLFFQYHPKGMIAAANDLKITTVDLQHGITNNAVVAYSYPTGIDLSHVSSISKFFLTLGQFWNSQINFPFKVITSGNTYYYIKQDKGGEERKGIMVVSVAFSHEDLQQSTANLAKQHPDIVFYYKLHSGQKHQEDACRSYFSSFPNVEVVYSEKNVNEIMDDCFAVVLIQSTVAFQALQKGLKVFILKKQYYEISYAILETKDVYLVENWEAISEKLNKEPRKIAVDKAPVFFEPYDPNILKGLVDHSN